MVASNFSSSRTIRLTFLITNGRSVSFTMGIGIGSSTLLAQYRTLKRRHNTMPVES